MKIAFLIASTSLAILFAVANPALSANCSKVPDHPSCSSGDPPPPPPDGNACANSAGVFPAVAFSRVIVTGKNRNRKETTELYVANSTGECSILVYSVPHGLIENIEYIQRADGEGRIIWDQETEAGASWRDITYPSIRMVTFDVSNRGITTTLPLVESTIYTLPIPESSGILDKVLSHDGDHVYFSVEEAGTDGVRWLNSLNTVDITTCKENCPFVEKFLIFPDEGVGFLGINDTNNRLFFTSHDRITDVYRLAFTEKVGSLWSNPTNIVTSHDAAYQGLRFVWLDAGSWPSQADPAFTGEIVSVTIEDYSSTTIGIDVFNTGACTVDENQSESCFAGQSSPMIRRFAGVRGSELTSLPFGSALPPSLFAKAPNAWVNIDLNSGATESVLGTLPIYDVDPAD